MIVPSPAAESGVGTADHSERPVTPVAVWTDALARRRPPRWDPTAHRRVVVVAAHPDDETLGAGGCLQVLRRSAAVVTLVVATDGEAASSRRVKRRLAPPRIGRREAGGSARLFLVRTA